MVSQAAERRPKCLFSLSLCKHTYTFIGVYVRAVVVCVLSNSLDMH